LGEGAASPHPHPKLFHLILFLILSIQYPVFNTYSNFN
jgi:hypothetical protein